MKKILSIFVLTIAFGLSYGQKSKHLNLQGVDSRPYHLGIYLAGNNLDFKVHPTTFGLSDSGADFNVLAKAGKGFSVGLIAGMPITDNISVRVEPGIDFNTRDLVFTNINDTSLLDTNYRSDSIRQVKSTYVNIPIIVKYAGNRVNNLRPYFSGGLGYAVNLTSNQASKDDNLSGVFRTKTHNFNWQVELGLEFYTRYVKVIPYAKGVFFFNNEIIPDNKANPLVEGSQDTPPYWAGSIESLKTRGILVGVKFEY